MTSSTSLVATILSLLAYASFLGGVHGATPCHICGDQGNGAMMYPDIILSNVGKTCTAISLEVALNKPFGSRECAQEQNKWKGRCCTPGQRPSGTRPPPGLPPQNIPAINYVGPHPPCKVCRDGDYPFATSMVINFLYIGEGSCAQYYKYGMEGRIQQHMCDPVKFFSYEPCGCGEFNPYFNSNHPLNQQAQQAPDRGNSGSPPSGGSNATPQQQRVPAGRGDASKCGQSIRGEGAGGAAAASKCGNRRDLEEVEGAPRKRGLKGAKKTRNTDRYDSTAVVVEDVVSTPSNQDE